MLGKLLKTSTGNVTEIATEELSSGLYLLKIYSDSNFVTKKFLKEYLQKKSRFEFSNRDFYFYMCSVLVLY